MYLLLPFYTALVLAVFADPAINGEPSTVQRYAGNPQTYHLKRRAANSFRAAPSNDFQYYAPRSERAAYATEQVDQRSIQNPVGIVYGNGRPIGFLQPYGRVYEVTDDARRQPTSDETRRQPVKKEYVDILYPVQKPAEQEGFEDEQLSKYTDNEYPSVLTNFKIDSRIKNRERPLKSYSRDVGKISKREAKGLTRENLDRLKAALDNFVDTPQSRAGVGEILGNMGFVQSLRDDAAAVDEDEDMEKGENAIKLTKEVRDVERRKTNTKAEKKEDKGRESREADEEYDEEEEDDRSQREKREETRTQTGEIMQTLEKSGDLTVSGNKSPLASANDAQKDNKQPGDKQGQTDEEKVAREIQAKIDAIKDQVKRQIAEIKDKSERKKRDTNNLTAAETSEIDPQLNSEASESHVRRKRSPGDDPFDAGATEPPSKSEISSPERRDYRAYREEEEDVDEEDDEFDDDGLDDRTAELAPRGRYGQPVFDYSAAEWAPAALRRRRRDSDRERAMRHLAAVRERSEVPRAKRAEEGEEDDGRLQIARMSETDLFGPLSQGYEGELARYKRVKRAP